MFSNSKCTRSVMGLLAGLGVVGLSTVAQAATVQLSTGVLLVKQSSNEKVSRGTGAGVMMPRLEMLNGNKLLAIWMEPAPDSVVPPSNASDNNGYWEGKTAIIQLNAEAARNPQHPADLVLRRRPAPTTTPGWPRLATTWSSTSPRPSRIRTRPTSTS